MHPPILSTPCFSNRLLRILVCNALEELEQGREDPIGIGEHAGFHPPTGSLKRLSQKSSSAPKGFTWRFNKHKTQKG